MRRAKRLGQIQHSEAERDVFDRVFICQKRFKRLEQVLEVYIELKTM